MPRHRDTRHGRRGPLLTALLLLGACAHTAPSAALTSERPDAPRVTLALPRHDTGEVVALASLRPHVLVLDVWATWCEPCAESLPEMDALARAYGPRGVQVLTINVDATPEAIAEFRRRVPFHLPILRDPEGEAVEQLGVQRVPTTLLIDRQGRVRFAHEGFEGGHMARYRAELEQLLAQPYPDQASARAP